MSLMKLQIAFRLYDTYNILFLRWIKDLQKDILKENFQKVGLNDVLLKIVDLIIDDSDLDFN